MISSRVSLGLLVVFFAACRTTFGGSDGSGGGKTATDAGTPTVKGTGDDPQGTSDGQEQAPTHFTGTAIRTGDTDNGVADESTPFRTLFNVPLLQPNELISAVHDIYTPGSATFRKYLSVSTVNATYMPVQATVDALRSWIGSNGMTVERVATNRLVIQVSGTIGAFNKAFATTVHNIKRGTNNIFATPGDDLNIPAPLIGKLDGVLTLEPPVVAGTPDTTGTVDATPPSDQGATVAFAQMLYGADSLPVHGAGETIVIVGGGAVRPTDTQSFWQSQTITRGDFTVNKVAEDPAAINSEATLDIEWSGGMAPDANVILYQAPDEADSALVFAFNEAVGKAEATVINDSFSHNEGVVPIQVRIQYDRSALVAAAQGITVISSSGDSSEVDAPGGSPYILSVGGVTQGNSVWNGSGGGQSSSFPLPDWQSVPAGATHRACPDIAALAENLWYYVTPKGYDREGGTSFSSPLTTGMFALLNSVRTAAGKPRVGWINSILYTTPAVQATFQDVLNGVSGTQRAAAGWDYTTGWGAPTIAKLADAIP